MTIQELKELKKKTEDEVRDLLLELEKQTGCYVGNVFPKHAYSLGKLPELVEVNIDLRLEN